MRIITDYMYIIAITQIIDNLVIDYRSLVRRLFPDDNGRARWRAL
jgi:hypothetical protein